MYYFSKGIMQNVLLKIIFKAFVLKIRNTNSEVLIYIQITIWRTTFISCHWNKIFVYKSNQMR